MTRALTCENKGLLVIDVEAGPPPVLWEESECALRSTVTCVIAKEWHERGWRVQPLARMPKRIKIRIVEK